MRNHEGMSHVPGLESRCEFCPHAIGQNSVMWPHSATRHAGKCSPTVHLGGGGDGLGVYTAVWHGGCASADADVAGGVGVNDSDIGGGDISSGLAVFLTFCLAILGKTWPRMDGHIHI